LKHFQGQYEGRMIYKQN